MIPKWDAVGHDLPHGCHPRPPYQSGEGGMGPAPQQPAFDRNGWSGRGEARRIGSAGITRQRYWHVLLRPGRLARIESLMR